MRRLAIALVAGLVAALTIVTAPAHAAESQRGTYYPLSPVRLMDTRNGTGVAKAPLGTASTVSLQIAGRGGVPASGASAVAVTLTAVAPTASTYLVAYRSGQARPGVSSLNTAAHQTRANSVTVAFGVDGAIALFNFAGRTDALVDVLGYSLGADSGPDGALGSDYSPITPQRFFDSRIDGGPLGPGDVEDLYLDFDTPAQPDLNTQVRAEVVNLTAVAPTASGYLTAWDGSSAAPPISTVNFASRQIVPNTAVVKTSACSSACDDPTVQRIAVVNRSSGSVDVLIDLRGLYVSSDYPSSPVRDNLRFTPVTPGRIVNTRYGVGGHGRLGPDQTATFSAAAVPGSVAGTTGALAANLTAIPVTGTTYLTVWADGARPGVSDLNLLSGASLSNGVTVPLTASLGFSAFNRSATTQVVVDVFGRFDAAAGGVAAHPALAPPSW